jgi:hypothetical protein
MNRKLKALGLALCATFALSVVAASAASAATDHIRSSSKTGSTFLAAKSLGNQDFFLETSGDPNGDRVRCANVGVTGSLPANTVSEATVTPAYSTCTARKGTSEFEAVVTTNECHYLFTGETTHTVGETEGEHATVHIICPEGSPGIQVQVTGVKLQCIDVPGGQTLHGVRYLNDTVNTNAIILKATVHGIKSTTTGACGEGTHEDGVYTGEVTVQGYEDEAHKKEVNLDIVEAATP